MRRRLNAALLIFSCAFVQGCGDDEDPRGARDLLGRVREDDYRSWERAPGYETRQRSSAPHSDAVDIYINDVIVEALVLGQPLEEWPEGSIITITSEHSRYRSAKDSKNGPRDSRAA